MGDPVIFDDGGSTRIKQVILPIGTSNGAMDGLLDVKDVPIGGGGTQAQSSDSPTGSFTTLAIVCIDIHGTPRAVAGIPALAPGDSFEIFSGGSQRVKGDIGAGGTCTLTVIGVNQTDPIVEGKQAKGAPKGQRRYIISNAGVIQRVDVGAATVFRLNGPGPIVPAGTVLPILYTTVVLT